MEGIIPKEYGSMDEILLKIKIKLQGWKREETINTTASDVAKLIDLMNDNYFCEDEMTEPEKKALCQRYCVLNDYKTKQVVMVYFPAIQWLEIPFLVDTGDNYKLQIADYRKV
jgi:hypothetical protein